MGSECSLSRKYLKIPTSFYVASSAWISRFVIAGIQLISIPFLLKMLGPEKYSWLVIAMSLQAWWIMADLGLSLALQNSISIRRARNESDADLIVHASILVLSITGFILLFLFGCAQQLAQWLLPPLANSSKIGNILILVTGISGLLLACGNIGYRILYARHQGYWVNIIPAVGAILSLCGLFLVKFLSVSGFVPVAIFWAMPTALIAFFVFLMHFIGAWRHVKQSIDRSLCRLLAKQGMQFGVFSILAAFTLQIDYIIIGKLMTDHDVLLYNVSTKTIAFVTFFFTAVVQAAWPICAEAAAMRDWGKVDKMLLWILSAGGALVSLGSLLVWCFRASIFSYLAPQQDILISPVFWGLLTASALLKAWSDTYAMLLQSMNKVKIFLLYIPFQSALCFFGQIYLGKRMGLNGVLIASIFSFLMTSVWLLPSQYVRIKRKSLSYAAA